MRSYRNVSIDRVPGSGYYRAMPDCGKHTGYHAHSVWVMAETVKDIQRAISGVMNDGCHSAGYGK
jgi:hypothetical protein